MSENIFQQFYCIAKDVSTYSPGSSYYTRLIFYKIDTVYNGDLMRMIFKWLLYHPRIKLKNISYHITIYINTNFGSARYDEYIVAKCITGCT